MPPTDRPAPAVPSVRACLMLPTAFRCLSAPAEGSCPLCAYRILFILMLALTNAKALTRVSSTSLSAWCGF